MLNRNDFSKIGIGTWGIGGFAERNPNNDDNKQIRALEYALSKGINFVEINQWYAEGHTNELVKTAINNSKVSRDELFLSNSLYDYRNPTISDLEKEFLNVLKTFETEFVDLIVFSQPSFKKYGFDVLVDFINKQLDAGRARYFGLTNVNLDYLVKLQKLFGNKLFSVESHYSFEVRDNESLGITEFADKNNILNVIYQPLRRNRTAKRNWPLLVKLSKKYGKTQNQILFNWLSLNKGFLPLCKAEAISHIDENLKSFDFSLNTKDYEALNNFKINNYKLLEIDWFQTGEGVKVHSLPNTFDELYPNN